RYAEDNGGTPPEFHITAYLHGLTLLADFARLRAALNTPGPGTFRHPWYGAQICAVRGPWKVMRDDRDARVLELEICFLVPGPPAYPSITPSVAASIAYLSTQAVESAWAPFNVQSGAPPSLTQP